MSDVAERQIVSVTRDMRTFLLEKEERNARDVSSIEDTTDSIYTHAHNAGLSVVDFIHQNPQKALKIAQSCVSSWERMLALGAMTGSIEDSTGNVYRIRREQEALIERAVENARKDFEYVQLVINAGSPDEVRKDRLISVLYDKAIKGDIKAIQYFIDRIEGRIPEQKDQGLDYDNAGYVYSILHTLFDKQLDILNSGPGTRMACCSRRAGKTHVIAALLLIECLRTKNTTCIYIGETMKMAEGLLNSAMNTIIDLCKLKDSKGNRLDWKRFENGSQIIVRGLSNTKDPDLIRGHKAKIIVIDEFFHLKSELLEYLQQEVLEPMQLDYANEYKQILIGTPPKIKGTHGEKMWRGLDVPKFHWTAKENPHIKNFDEFVAEKCREKGIDTSHPYIRREYFGEWAYDTDALLFPEYHTYNRETVPTFDIDRILCGVDYGVSDNNTLIAIAWDSSQRRGYVFYEVKFNRLTCDKHITMLQQLKDEVKMLWQYALDFWPNLSKKDANKRIMWEADSSDQQLTQELQFNVKLEDYPDLTLDIGNAHKADKVLMHDKIRDMLRSAALLLPENGATARECEMTILKRDVDGNIYPEVDDKAFHPDLLAALRYAMWPAIGLEVTGG